MSVTVLLLLVLHLEPREAETPHCSWSTTFNRISIQESSVPSNLDQFVDQYLGGKCFTVLDLYWGFDARKMDETSCDMTALPNASGNAKNNLSIHWIHKLSLWIPRMHSIYIQEWDSQASHECFHWWYTYTWITNNVSIWEWKSYRDARKTWHQEIHLKTYSRPE